MRFDKTKLTKLSNLIIKGFDAVKLIHLKIAEADNTNPRKIK